MRLLLITDAWYPQVNGVVRTLNAVIGKLREKGHEVLLITPEGRPSKPMPLYPEITLTLTGAKAIGAEIRAANPDAIHIATEGPLGWAGRKACLAMKLPFTTGFHTRFAEYAAKRIPLPGIAHLGWQVLKHFHKPSRAVMVPTASIRREVEARGLGNVKTWTRGVDRNLFYPRERVSVPGRTPVLLYAGRLAIEKGIEDFLALKTEGTKMLVGDGPERARLERLHPEAVFHGYLHDAQYAECLAQADVMIFPSRTDTFGLVMLEAMACGTPVAAFNVPSPVDVVTEGATGALDASLDAAVERALKLDRARVHEASQHFTWERTAEMFESWLVPLSDRDKQVLSGLPKAA